jgi:hypothetical protein
MSLQWSQEDVDVVLNRIELDTLKKERDEGHEVYERDHGHQRHCQDVGPIKGIVNVMCFCASCAAITGVVYGIRFLWRMVTR